MTSTRETQAIAEALALIDRGLGDMQRRSLVSGDEVANLLLDVRLLLMMSEEAEPQLNWARSATPASPEPPVRRRSRCLPRRPTRDGCVRGYGSRRPPWPRRS